MTKECSDGRTAIDFAVLSVPVLEYLNIMLEIPRFCFVYSYTYSTILFTPSMYRVVQRELNRPFVVKLYSTLIVMGVTPLKYVLYYYTFSFYTRFWVNFMYYGLYLCLSVFARFEFFCQNWCLQKNNIFCIPKLLLHNC